MKGLLTVIVVVGCLVILWQLSEDICEKVIYVFNDMVQQLMEVLR